MAAAKPDEKDSGGGLDGWDLDDILEDEEVVWTEDMLPKFETPTGPVTPQVAVKPSAPAPEQPAAAARTASITGLAVGEPGAVSNTDQASGTGSAKASAEAQTGEGSQPDNVGAARPADKPAEQGVRPKPEPQRESVREAQFVPLGSTSQIRSTNNIDLLQDVPLQVTVELGRTTMVVRDILALGPGSIIELDRAAGEMVDVMVNGKLIARGEVVVIDENFGVRITEIASETQRGGHNE